MKRERKKRSKLQTESRWISRENCCEAKAAKQRKRFPERICAASKNCVFKQKWDKHLLGMTERSDQLHHPRARGWSWCLLSALQVCMTYFKISALMFSREARNTRAFVLRWKINRFPVVTSNPRRNVKSSYLRFLLLRFLLQDHVIWLKTSLHCKLFKHFSFTCYSSCCISFDTLESISSEGLVPLWHDWLDG